MPLNQKTAKKKKRCAPPPSVLRAHQKEDLLHKLPKLGGKQVETTIGDLICAIYDAANEVSRNEKLVNHLTQMTLNDILKKKKAAKKTCG